MAACACLQFEGGNIPRYGIPIAMKSPSALAALVATACLLGAGAAAAHHSIGGIRHISSTDRNPIVNGRFTAITKE